VVTGTHYTAPSDTKYRKSGAAYPCCGTKARLILNKFSDLGLLVNELHIGSLKRFILRQLIANQPETLCGLWWPKVALGHVSSENSGSPVTITRGADKSLAQPGRKQATTTKLGIYSTYSPRSSIHFLARCSNFCKPLKKKKFRRLSVQPGLRGSNDLCVGRPFNWCFSPGNRW